MTSIGWAVRLGDTKAHYFTEVEDGMAYGLCRSRGKARVVAVSRLLERSRDRAERCQICKAAAKPLTEAAA